MTAKKSHSEDSMDAMPTIVICIIVFINCASLAATIAIVVEIFSCWRRKTKDTSEAVDLEMTGNDYITQSNPAYTAGSLNPYATYQQPDDPAGTPAPDYDYIGDDYLTVDERPGYYKYTAVSSASNRNTEHYYSRIIGFQSAHARNESIGTVYEQVSNRPRNYQFSSGR